MTTPSPLENLQLIYERNAKMNEIFIEWRNKILGFGSSAIAVTIAATEYVHQNDKHWSWVPGVIGFIIATAMFAADYRNARILKQIYTNGKNLEASLGYEGFYAKFEQDAKITYGRVLASVCVCFGVLVLFFGVISSF